MDEKIKFKIIDVLKKNGIKKAGVIGSYAAGKQTKGSDIDILIEFNGGLMDLVEIELELKKVLKRKVDLITYGGINPLLKKKIIGEEIKIL